MSNPWQVDPGSTVSLAKHDPRDTSHAPGDRAETEEKTAPLHSRLLELQERLYAEHEHSLLVILQGTDASGKDGTVSHVFQGVNPLGTQASAFKVPTEIERDHDFLWRIHPHVPAKGQMSIFNRSHYEDVLSPTVHKLIDHDERDRRLDRINDFELLLTQSGTRVVKLFLHVSKDEQRKRLQERLDTPSKQWKMNLSDLKERAFWSEYQQAYEHLLEKSSTQYAPWHIVPSDRKWLRNYVVSTIIIEVLEKINPKNPEVPSFDGVVIAP